MTTFADLGLSPEVLRAVEETGYTIPTPIQEQAIPVALMGLDILGIAQTGTGKTASFTLPLIEKLAAGRAKARMPRSLVLAPTRELADQVAASFEKYAKYHKLSWALLIGGVSMADQVSKLDRGVDVLIATPGRLLDLFDRSKVMLNGVSMMVIDEADRMLDMGFIPDIERIFKLTPPSRQTLFFSATMPPEITRLTEQFLKNPVRIEVSRPATTGENITQYVTKVPVDGAKAKRIALRALISRVEVKNGIVFCNRKTDVDIVAKSLKVHGFDAAPIHGDLDQSLRTKTLESFRNGDLTLLVASDVAARGLDIPDVGHVFNFEPPHHADDYVHRIGRTGRAGRTGEAYLIVGPSDVKNYDKVLKLTKKEPQLLELDGIDWSEAEGDTGGRKDRKRTRPESRTKDERPSRRRAKQEDKPESRLPTDETPTSSQRTAISVPRDRSPEPRISERDSRETGSRWRRDRDNDYPVQGFGDMVPAFMRRAALPPLSEAEDTPAESPPVVKAEATEPKAKAKPKPRTRKKKTSDENMAAD